MVRGHPTGRRTVFAPAAVLSLALLLAACSGGSGTKQAALLGPKDSPEYAAAQARDLPPGLVRCDYSGPIPRYAENLRAIGVDPKAIEGTWNQLREKGATDSFITVYTDTPEACQVWVKGGPEGHVHAGSRIVSTVVAKFPDEATAQVAYAADVFGQSKLVGQQGLRVQSGNATKLGINSVVGANEAANPSVHQAVWQAGPFNVFFTSRNLTRPEFEQAITAENARLS